MLKKIFLVFALLSICSFVSSNEHRVVYPPSSRESSEETEESTILRNHRNKFHMSSAMRQPSSQPQMMSHKEFNTYGQNSRNADEESSSNNEKRWKSSTFNNPQSSSYESKNHNKNSREDQDAGSRSNNENSREDRNAGPRNYNQNSREDQNGGRRKDNQNTRGKLSDEFRSNNQISREDLDAESKNYNPISRNNLDGGSRNYNQNSRKDQEAGSRRKTRGKLGDERKNYNQNTREKLSDEFRNNNQNSREDLIADSRNYNQNSREDLDTGSRNYNQNSQNDLESESRNNNQNPRKSLNSGFRNNNKSSREDLDTGRRNHNQNTRDKLNDELRNNNQNSPKKKNSEKNNKNGKQCRLCEQKFMQYMTRIFNDEDTVADGSDADFNGRVLAEPGQYPHMTAIGFTSPNKATDYKCGGSLISENFVITAAHCTNVMGQKPTKVRIGDLNLMVDENYLEPQIRNVKKINNHPDYQSSLHYNDIALLELDAEVSFTEFVRPIRLWTDMNIPANTVAFAMGYGATAFGKAPTQRLTDLNITVLANNDCNKQMPEMPEAPLGILESQICGKDYLMNRDTCQGDSGGPLQLNFRGRRRQQHQHYHLIGITSYGLACRSSYPSVYTRITYFLDWIEEVVWST